MSKQMDLAVLLVAFAVPAASADLEGVWAGETAQVHKIEITVGAGDAGPAVVRVRYKMDLVGKGRDPGTSAERAELLEAPCPVPETAIYDQDLSNHYRREDEKWAVTTSKTRSTKPPIPIEDGRFEFEAEGVYEIEGVFEGDRLTGEIAELMECTPRLRQGEPVKAKGETTFEARKL